VSYIEHKLIQELNCRYCLWFFSIQGTTYYVILLVKKDGKNVNVTVMIVNV